MSSSSYFLCTCFRSSHEGATIGQSCGSILHGDAVVMCEKSGRRELVCRNILFLTCFRKEICT